MGKIGRREGKLGRKKEEQVWGRKEPRNKGGKEKGCGVKEPC